MAKVKILIVEDELLVAEDLAAWLEDYGFDIIGIASSASDALELYRDQKPDVALIDINLEGEMDGVELAHVINQSEPIPLIYLSGNYDPLTMERVKHTNPANFIVKPFEENQLSVSIDMAIANFALQRSPTAKTETPDPKDNDNFYILRDRIFIKNRNKRDRIMLKDILYIKADNQYADLFTNSGRYTLGFTLSTSLERLNHHQFCRVSKSYIVNLNYVEGLGYGDNSLFVAEQEIRIGPKFKEEFLMRLRRL